MISKKRAIEILKGHEACRECCLDTNTKCEECTQAFELAYKALLAYRNCSKCVHKFKAGNMYGCELWDCDYEEAEV